MAQKTAMSRLKAFWDSPTGLKTTHFWGPIANWGFVVAGIADTSKPAEVRACAANADSMGQACQWHVHAVSQTHRNTANLNV